jgi:hypothetical protein
VGLRKKLRKQKDQLKNDGRPDIYQNIHPDKRGNPNRLGSSFVSERMKKRSILNSDIFKRDGIDYKQRVKDVVSKMEYILSLKSTDYNKR